MLSIFIDPNITNIHNMTGPFDKWLQNVILLLRNSTRKLLFIKHLILACLLNSDRIAICPLLTQRWFFQSHPKILHIYLLPDHYILYESF